MILILTILYLLIIKYSNDDMRHSINVEYCYFTALRPKNLILKGVSPERM